MEFPASFMLVAATNPCPCGYLSSRVRSCRCSLAQMELYRRRLSGPLIDRIDIHVEVPEITWEDLRNDQEEEDSETLRRRMERTRETQKKRYRFFSFSTNGEMDENAMKFFCKLDPPSEALLKKAMKELGLSARAHGRILKIARTLADMDESETIQEHHLAEAVRYRILDRQFIHV
jgi:magnesium chelatase family protein